MAMPSLQKLRISLTLWYLSTFGAILLLLGGGVFAAIRHQYGEQLEASLRDAAHALEQAARTREAEAGARGHVVDAVEELHVAGRSLYLLRADGVPDTPSQAPAWLHGAAASARVRPARGRYRSAHDHTLRWYAEPFVAPSGRAMIAVAVADQVELEDRYASLIAVFAGAAIGALLLVAGGGWLLVRQATAPVERNITRMRQFMADAAHELRTPITVLRTQIDVALQRERSAAGYALALQNVEAEGRRLGRIVDDLLILARADSGERAIARQRVFVDDIVADAVSAAAAMATARRVALGMDQFDEGPVDGDPELLRQLVMILLDNAIKFTPAAGSVRVSVRDDASTITVVVADSGPGIPADALPHVFERFYRADASRRRDAASGAGLGLAIARWIADAHDASLTLTSPAQGGTLAVLCMARAVAVSSS